MTFEKFSRVNLERCKAWHPGFPNDAWTGADWSNAMCGEAGETANVVKKLRRAECGTPGAVDPDYGELLADLADEIGDVYAYLDLLASYYEIDIEEAIRNKFNFISDREGLPNKL